MLYPFYRSMTGLSGPFLKAMTARRLGRSKEHPARYVERYGETTRTRPAGKIMWLHGASVGEALSVLPLLNTLKSRLPDWHFLLTTGTLTSAEVMAQRLPDWAIHQFIPWDHPRWVKRFFDHWQPDAVVWLESELWPNILNEMAQRGVPSCLINARMRPKSYEMWRRMPKMARKMLGSFTFILTGARDYVAYFKDLGGRNVSYIGALKFGASPLPVNPIREVEFRQQIKDRFCIGFTSTHPGDEEIAARVHRELKTIRPDLLTLIVPRKISRGSDVVQDIARLGLNTALRSRHEAISKDTDIYVADTIGETGLWFKHCPIVVIGGSFHNFGGQNPLEGIHFGCAVLYGPSMFNFIDIAAKMEEAKAARRVEDEKDLLRQLKELLSSQSALDEMRQASRLLGDQNLSVIDSYADEIMIQLVEKI